MEKIEKDRYQELIEKYPLGCLLFAIDHKDIIIPNGSQLKSRLRINWDSAEVILVTPEKIMIMLPDIYSPGFKMNGCTFGFRREVGVPNEILCLNGIQAIAEILSDDDSGIIALIGFKK